MKADRDAVASRIGARAEALVSGALANAVEVPGSQPARRLHQNVDDAVAPDAIGDDWRSPVRGHRAQKLFDAVVPDTQEFGVLGNGFEYGFGDLGKSLRGKQRPKREFFFTDHKVAQCIDLIDKSGLDYELHSMGTIVEGELDDVLRVLKQCVEKVAESSDRVTCSAKLDYRKSAAGRLKGKVARVEQQLGRSVKK